MKDQTFTIEASISSFFGGSSMSEISVELKPDGTALLKQSGVNITLAPDQVLRLALMIENHKKS